MKTKIIAHRGASGDYPQNTILAFEKAIEQGADMIETDVRKTKDGVLVIMHDNHFGNVSELSKDSPLITESNFDDIKDIDISSKHFPDLPVQYIPRLSDLLEIVKKTGIEVNLEIKPNPFRNDGLEYDIYEMVEQYGVQDKILYSSFDHVILNNIKQNHPEARIGLLYSSAIYNISGYAVNMKAEAVHPQYTLELVKNQTGECLDAALEINAWTVNNAEDAKKLISRGVTGIITNYPKEIINAINE